MKMQIEIAVKMPKATRQPGLPETGRGKKKKKRNPLLEVYKKARP